MAKTQTDRIFGRQIPIAAIVMCLMILLGLTVVKFTDWVLQPSANVAEAIAGGGVEVGRIDSSTGSLSIRSVNDMFVVLVFRHWPLGVAAHPTFGPTLCRVLDSPAMLAELHTALSAGTHRASIVSEYEVKFGGGGITVSSSGKRVTILLRSPHRTVLFATTADELRRLSDELTGFILRHGGGGTVRTPVS